MFAGKLERAAAFPKGRRALGRLGSPKTAYKRCQTASALWQESTSANNANAAIPHSDALLCSLQWDDTSAKAARAATRMDAGLVTRDRSGVIYSFVTRTKELLVEHQDTKDFNGWDIGKMGDGVVGG